MTHGNLNFFMTQLLNGIVHPQDLPPVCGELVLKPRQADGIGLGSDYASGRNLDLQPSVIFSQFSYWVCHRSTHNGTAARCRTP